MAVIQKIRTKYAKLAGFVIALALVGFILMDAASGGLNSLFGNDTTVAEVNGEEIDIREYQQRVRDYEVLYSYSSQGRPLDDATRAQLNDQALKELINEKLIGAQAEELGITTTESEAKDIIYSANPDPLIQQYPIFKNEETGRFDPQRIKLFEQQVNQIDPSGRLKEEWETLKAYVLRNNLVKKYNALITHSLYLPDYVIKQQLTEQTSRASIKYVKVPYSTVGDGEVKVTDAELKAYMVKHKPLYMIHEPTRSIEYVSFEVIPSNEDTARSLGALTKIEADFAATEDAESFVNRNSDEPYNGTFVTKRTFMSAYSDSIMSLDKGAVFGPYFENSAYKLTKVVEKKILPDSVRSRHILVKTEDRGQAVLPDSLAKKRIDSVVAAIRSGARFDTLVVKVSDDEGSAQTGGEYTFTLQQRAQISKEFGDFVFEGSVGEKKVVKVDNDAYAGYHYIEILDQSGMAPAVKLATISKSLFAGDRTENATYARASEFAGQNNTATAFDEAAKKQNLNKKIAENIKANDFTIPGMGNSREVIRWAYDAEVGSVSPIFQMSGSYVVAKLTAKKEPGVMELDANLRPNIEAAVKNQKKADILREKYKSATSLEALSTASGQTIMQADSFNASQPYVPNLGYEPKVVGYSFYQGFKIGAVSPFIEGPDGLLRVSLLSRSQRPMPKDDAVIKQMKGMQQMQMQNSLIGDLDAHMLRSAEIEYNSDNL